MPVYSIKRRGEKYILFKDEQVISTPTHFVTAYNFMASVITESDKYLSFHKERIIEGKDLLENEKGWKVKFWRSP